MNDIVPANFYDTESFHENSELQFPEIEYHTLKGAAHLIGRICLHVERHEDMISMIFDDGSFAVMLHHDDCCEDVNIEDINGDLNDLIGVPINVADERFQDDENASESATWTFYCLRTIKGSIDIRWYGSSNGYYSETASIDVREPIVPLTSHARLRFLKHVKEWQAARNNARTQEVDR